MNEEAAEYRARQLRREEKARQEALRIEASYRLAPGQQCIGGIVINRSGSSFSQAVGSKGQPIKCSGDKAEEPLR